MEKGLTEPVLDFIEDLAPLAEELDISMSELSLAWLLDRPRVAMTLVGCRNFEQLEMCIKAAEVRLEQGITDQIDEMLVRAGLHEEVRNTPSEIFGKVGSHADTSLLGKIAIVTGAGQGIGKGIALGLAARGASVLVLRPE